MRACTWVAWWRWGAGELCVYVRDMKCDMECTYTLCDMECHMSMTLCDMSVTLCDMECVSWRVTWRCMRVLLR